MSPTSPGGMHLNLGTAGQLIEVQWHDSFKAHKIGQHTWQITDQSGTYCVRCELRFYPDSSALWQRFADGTVISFLPEGKRVVYKPGPASIHGTAAGHELDMEIDRQNSSTGSGRRTPVKVVRTGDRVTRTIDIEGRVTSYEYDEDALLRRVTFPNGKLAEYIYDEDHWIVVDPRTPGKATKWQGEMAVDPSNGDLLVTYSDGMLERLSPRGYRHLTTPDRENTWTVNSCNQIVHWKDKYGVSTRYQYARDSQLVEVLRSTGFRAVRLAGRQWEFTDRTGTWLFSGDVKVNGRDPVLSLLSDDGTVTIFTLNATKETYVRSGSWCVHDINGKPLRARKAGGEEIVNFSWTASGRLRALSINNRRTLTSSDGHIWIWWGPSGKEDEFAGCVRVHCQDGSYKIERRRAVPQSAGA